MNCTALPSFPLGRANLTVGALFLLALASAGALAAPGISELPIEGAARVVDGDTIDIAGRRIRLEGIDAPEAGQTCRSSDGTDWACGQAASGHLRSLVGKEPIRCTERGEDKYGRTLAYCFTGATNLNQAMVADGYAWAFVKYSSAFVAEEAAARAARAGIWQGTAEAPWDFRAGHWQTAEQQAPAGCAIKGNISNNGHIYHLPWSPWYAKVKIDTARGEKWFCNESDAIAAGWRPASAN